MGGSEERKGGGVAWTSSLVYSLHSSPSVCDYRITSPHMKCNGGGYSHERLPHSISDDVTFGVYLPFSWFQITYSQLYIPSFIFSVFHFLIPDSPLPVIPFHYISHSIYYIHSILSNFQFPFCLQLNLLCNVSMTSDCPWMTLKLWKLLVEVPLEKSR